MNIIDCSEHSDVTEPSERKTICLPGRPGLTEVEVADLLLHEARTYLTVTFFLSRTYIFNSFYFNVSLLLKIFINIYSLKLSAIQGWVTIWIILGLLVGHAD